MANNSLMFVEWVSCPAESEQEAVEMMEAQGKRIIFTVVVVGGRSYFAVKDDVSYENFPVEVVEVNND